MKSTLFAVTFATLLCTVDVHAATATLFGGGYTTKELYSIDLATAARTSMPISPSLQDGINGLTYNSKDGYLYATIADPSTAGSHPIKYYKIDPNNFAVTTSNFSGITLGLGDLVDSLEYDLRRDGFWGTIPSRRQLIFVDGTTGQGQIIGQFAIADHPLISGIAYDPVSDILYGVNDPGSPTQGSTTLVRIDRTTLALTVIGMPGLGLGLYDMDSLALNPLDGMLYSINDGSSGDGPHKGQLVRIDPLTGGATLLGNPSPVIESYQGLAFVVVPEPDSFEMLICAAIVICAGFPIRSRNSD